MKKLLALVLALVMVMGLATVSASATTFSDDADIDHQEAVEVMNALNIINGMGDGKFDPNGNVTRAQMAKMVTIALLGDVEVSAFTGTATDLKDVSGHWAEGYIKYCYSQGIISGRGNGIFDPNANVTTAEASKMLLVAMGYNSDVRKYTGDQWAINVARDAQQRGLYKEISNLTSNKPMDRDDAAQLIYNTLTANMIKAEESINSDGTITTHYSVDNDKSLLSETFKGKVEYTYLTDSSYNTTTGKYTYSFANDAAFGDEITADVYDDVDLKSDTDYSALFGQKVKVVYEDTTDASKRTVYGIYGQGKVVAENIVDNVTQGDNAGTALANNTNTTEIKIDGTKYKLDKTMYDGTAADATQAYVFNAYAAPATGSVAAKYLVDTAVDYWNFQAIDNDDDGKIDVFVVFPVTAQKVTYVGGNSITAGVSYKYNKDTKNYSTTADTAPFFTFPEGIAKDDYVLIPGYGATNANREITKIEPVEGKVTGEKDSSSQINGTWYEKNGETLTLNSTYKVWAVNGFAVASKTVSTASKDLAIVLNEEAATALTGIKAKVMWPDGNTEIIEISKIAGNNVAATDTLADEGGLSALDNTDDSDRLITWKKLDNGTYDVKKVSTGNLAGYDKYINGTDGDFDESTSSAVARLDGARIADDAVIFVQYNQGTYADAKWTVITGAALKSYKDITTVNVEGLYSTSGGVDTIKVAFMSTAFTNFNTSSTFAYITSAPYSIKDGSNTYYTYDVWTKDGAMTVKDTRDVVSAGAGQAHKGDLVCFVSNTDGSVTSTAMAEDSEYQYAAVTGWQESDEAIVIHTDEGAKYFDGKLDKDTVVLYVDTENHTGVEGGAITAARESAHGTYYQNALAVYDYDGSGILDLLVIDLAGTYGGNDVEIGFTVSDVASATSNNITYAATASQAKAIEGQVISYTLSYAASDSVALTNVTTIKVAGVTLAPTDLEDIDGTTIAQGTGGDAAGLTITPDAASTEITTKTAKLTFTVGSVAPALTVSVAA